MKFKPVKTAVIGAGMISDIYLQNLKDTFSIIDLVGCSDLVESKAQAQAEKYGIKKMTNEEILNDPEIELVVNLTYASAHFEVNKQILEAGKHCYSEKMMCITQEEADILTKISKEKNVMFAAAPDTFLGASQQTARYIVDRGLIGTPLQAIVHLSRGYFMIKSDEDDAYRKYSVVTAGGGIPYDMGGYYLHELFNIFGSVNRVCGFAKTNNQTRPYLNPKHSKFNEDYFTDTINTISATLEFDCGLYATFSMSSDYNTTNQIFEIIGTEGRLILADPNNFGDKVYLQKNGNEPVEFPICHPYSENSRGIGAADMAWALRTGRAPRLSTEMGYHALEIINAVIDCTNDNKVKTLKTKFERPAPISSEFYGRASQERNLFIV